MLLLASVSALPRNRKTPQPPPRVLYQPPSGVRTTVPPKFDMEQYARESDERIRSADAPADSPTSEGSPSIVAREELSDADAESVYGARIGDPGQVVVCTRSAEELLRMARNAGEGFVLALVDGKRTVGEILRACELPRLAALAALCDLLESGIVAVKAR